ncbi:hypothetical protein [Alkalihalobacterium bogoriense]|uniref:hypothetical protein n=1 Tax=Alkalihalobacterium bogoriense TaxID=246272 RepID=UPI00047CE5AD|nr:hypothetical protein [Alkalihalobacterium bogoriense]
MFRKAITDVHDYIKQNVKTLSGEELYDLKRGFYEKCAEYMGHSNNLTGITELLINLYLKSFLEANKVNYSIHSNFPLEGANGRVNELDIALVNNRNKVDIGFSIKREQGNAGWKKHELDCEICKSYRQKYGKDNIVQDLYRLDNLKRGKHGSFKSVTFIFEEVNKPTLARRKRIQEDNRFNHYYIVLQGNNQLLWEELKIIIN